MSSFCRSLSLRLLAVTLAGLACSAHPVAGQLRGPQPISRTQFGVGFVANAPDAVLGGSAYILLPRWGGTGLYVDAKFDNSNPSDELGFDGVYTSRRVADELGGSFVKREASWRSVNVAILHALTPSFMAYAGGGIATASYFDLYANLPLNVDVGHGGVTWVESPEDEATMANFMAGIMFRLTGRVTTQFGYETRPKGVTAGASLRLPSW